MASAADYQLQFFRQWLGDTGIADVPAMGALDEVKAVAQANLEAFANERTGRGRPRVVRIVEWRSREILAEFRLTQNGPVEMSRAPPKTGSPAAANPRLRLVEGPQPLDS